MFEKDQVITAIGGTNCVSSAVYRLHVTSQTILFDADTALHDQILLTSPTPSLFPSHAISSCVSHLI